MSEDGLLTADNPTWYSADNADFVTTKGWDSADSAISSYQELEKSMGGRIKMPNDESTPEEKSAFYQKLGRPDSIDGYTRPELSEGQEFDEAFLSDMATVAHEAGVTDGQFNKLIERYIGNQSSQAEAKVEAETRESQATVEELQREWVGDYEKNLEVSKRAIRELVPEDMKEAFSEVMASKNLDNNLTFIKTMHSIGKQLLDDTLVKGEAPKSTGDYVPANINSPEMYRFGEGEESQKARAYFESQGFKY